MQFQQGTADIANAGGIGAGFSRSLFNNHNLPDWMRRYGLGGNDVLSAYGAYGNRGDYGRNIQSIVSASGMANQSAYLGGLGINTYAAGLGQFETLTGDDYIRNHNYAATGGIPNQDADGGFQSTNPGSTNYFKRLQQVMQAATTYGLDHSKVYTTLNGLFQTQAIAGGANLDWNKTSGFWNRLSSGGLASMRSGEGVQQALQGISGAIGTTGYGGDSVRTMALQSYFAKHGGMPTSVGALGKMLGFDPNNMSPTEKYMAQNAISAAKSGNILAFQTAIQPFEQSNPQFFQNVASDFSSQFGTDRATRDLITGNISGAGYGGTAAYNSGSGMPSVQGSVYGSISDSTYSEVMAAAKKYNVDPSWLLSIAGQESTFGTNPAERHGLMDITQPAFDQVKKMGMIPSDWTLADITSDPVKNAQVGAAYLKYQLSRSGGDYGTAVTAYNGGGDPDYLAHVSRFHDTITNANGGQNNLLAASQRLDMNTAEQAYNTAGAAFGGPVGDALISFSGKIVDATGAIAGFTTAIQNFLASSGMTSGSPGSHVNHGQGTGNTTNKMNPGRGGAPHPVMP